MKLYGVRTKVSKEYVRKVMVDPKWDRGGKPYYFSSVPNFVSVVQAELFLKYAKECDIDVEFVCLTEEVECVAV